jgi:prepilin-type processing-associated H-X9-DG protein
LIKKNITQSCFSFIELIVVFAILAILASLLQPSLKKIIDQSNVLKCSNNYKFLHLNFIQYLEDHTKYPNALTNEAWSDRGSITWDDFLGMDYDGRNISKATAKSYSVTYDNGGSKTLLDFYRCPSDERTHPVRAIRSYTMNVNRYWRSDRQGVSNFYDNGKRWTASVHEVPAPSRTFLLAERFSTFLGTVGSGVSATYWQTPTPPHLGFHNYLFADGHTERFTFEETYDPALPAHIAGKYWTRDPND